MIDLSKYKLNLWITRPYGISREFYYLKSMYDAGMKFFLVIPEDDVVGSYYFDWPSYLKVLEKSYKKALKNYKRHLADYPAARKRILDTSKKLSYSIGKVSDQELFGLYQDYVDSVYAFFDYVFLPFALIEYTEPELSQKFPNDFETIINAYQPSEYQVMEKMILEEAPEKVVEKYAWLNSYYIGEDPYTVEDIKEIKKSLDVGEIEKLWKEFPVNKKKFNNFIKTVKDEELKAKSILLHEYAFLRNDRVDAWKNALFLITDFFRYLQSKYKNVSLKAITNITYEEIEDILVKNNLPPEDEISKRDRNLVYYHENNKTTIVSDPKLAQELRDYVRGQVSKIKELKGTPAFKGKIKAKVVVVDSNKHLDKVKEGDVLVARVTDPRFTPYMRKASAIITDEGGMLSHAAITSRELQLPCIVGTKDATQVLKDGDMVEVDADKGIIKILK